MQRTFAASALYFVLVFVAAFVFGTIRTFVLEPRLGETLAVASEIPLLVMVMFFAARFTVRRVNPPRSPLSLLAIGVIGLALQQVAELGLIFASGETLAQHGAYLGTPPGRLYLGSLFVFVLMPLLVGRRT